MVYFKPAVATLRHATQWSLAAADVWRRATMELVYPAGCVGCGKEIMEDDPTVRDLSICRECFERLELLNEPLCRKCGGPLPRFSRSEEQGGCSRCRGRKLWFENTVAAGLYDGLIRELVLRMKVAEGNRLSLAMGRLVWQHCGERLAKLEADVVVPIPLHWRRRLTHRTNSASVMAEVFARQLRIPLAERLLRRCRHTERQAELTPPQRWENVRRAFSVRTAYHLRKAHVLVVDDILTTGATCSEAARMLRKAGAGRVTVVVAARAIG